jgi:quinol monooxygenase YgiN
MPTNRARALLPQQFAALVLAMLIGWPAEAQTADPAIIGVTAINVMPNIADKGLDLLKSYRDAALKQPGNAEVTLLEEINWPNRFVLYETWNGQSNYDDNEKSPQTTSLREGLRVIEGSIDRRNYHIISKETPKPAPSGAVYVVLHLDVFPPGLAATLEAGRNVSMAARRQDENARYEFTQQVSKTTSHSTLLSVWTSPAGYDNYQNSKYARQFRETVGPLLGSPFDERLYRQVK